jgi:hypothetical protein
MSLRLQRVAGQWEEAGLLVAMDMTSPRSAGGKAPRSPGARRILQAVETVREIALTPTTDGMTRTVHLGGALTIRGAIWRSSP